MANPFPFVAGSVLTAAELNGIGEARLFRLHQHFTNYTRGNGTSIAYYMQVNKLVYVYVKETLGSTSSVTGVISMTLPIAAVRAQAVQMARARIATLRYRRTGLLGYNFWWHINGYFVRRFSERNLYGVCQHQRNCPFDLGHTDAFQFAFVYEVA
jgi:hypothetical protein